MKSTASKTLTQAQLVQKLHDRGCEDITLRRISIWRKHDVLPPFDVIGGGRGRGQGGRRPSGWHDGNTVLNQALWVYRLLTTYSSFVDLYLPLWLLGFPIPLNRIREGLAKPLETTIEDGVWQIDGRDAIEDFIDDAAYEFSDGVKRANWNILDMPPEALAAIMNILLNSTYNLEDEPFEHAVESIHEWEKNFQQKCIEFLDDSQSVARAEQLPSESGIFRHASFVNTFLSIPHLREVVSQCSDADLLAVHNDVERLRKIVREVERLLPVLLRYLPPEMQPKPDDLVETILSAGKTCLWVDLSLRRSGYGDLIEEVLTLMLEGIRRQSIEDVEREIEPYEVEIHSFFSMMIQLGTWLTTDSTSTAADATQ